MEETIIRPPSLPPYLGIDYDRVLFIANIVCGMVACMVSVEQNKLENSLILRKKRTKVEFHCEELPKKVINKLTPIGDRQKNTCL